MIRILLADDHPVVRDGLAAMLATQPDFEVVGEAGNGAEALTEAARLRPDVVLMDLEMPELDGIEAIRRLRAADPSVQVVVLTAFDTDERIVAAQNKLERVGLVNGEAIPARHPFIRRRSYEREVEGAPHGFVFFDASLREGADRSPGAPAAARVRQLARFTAVLERAGYRSTRVGPFVVYALDGRP